MPAAQATLGLPLQNLTGFGKIAIIYQKTVYGHNSYKPGKFNRSHYLSFLFPVHSFSPGKYSRKLYLYCIYTVANTPAIRLINPLPIPV
jgi:hypothetical protein